jgi:hypothetical protein
MGCDDDAIRSGADDPQCSSVAMEKGESAAKDLPKAAGDLPARFWNKVESRDDGCWRWTGSVSDGGYGYFWLDGRNQRAHRVAYIFLRGQVPDGLVLDHLCRVRNCVNPMHLEPVSTKENINRGVSPSALNRGIERCKHGHLFDESNTIVRSDRGDQRECRACGRAARRRFRQRQRTRQNP